MRERGYDAAMASPHILDFPSHLQAPGTTDAEFEPALSLTELPPGAMARVTFGDLDVLVAHTDAGLVAVEDRCPHMSAPLSAGRLDDCTLRCPLHGGAFDVRDGEVVIFPTTGGLTADGEYRPTWTPEGKKPKAPLPPNDSKAQARAMTRVRRLRYFPLRVSGDMVEIARPR
jgi:nitrite reductase/ring-hydroxylating ferredoxin subunit